MADLKEILIITAGRSGSNLLCNQLLGLESNAGMYEIMSQDGLNGLELYPDLLKRTSMDLLGFEADKSDQVMIDARNADKVACVDVLARNAAAAGFTSMSYKVTEYQMKNEDIGQILARPQIRVIFLTRKRIDRHISLIKGTAKKTFIKEDTTDFRPHMDLSGFLKESFLMDQFYEECLAHVRERGVPFATLTYDDDLDLPNDERLTHLTAALSKIGVDPQFKTSATAGWMVKQDKNPNWRDKISNGFDIAAGLSGLGLADYAEQSPLLDLIAHRSTELFVAASPRDNSFLERRGWFLALNRDPVITFTAVQFNRSVLADWMGTGAPAFGTRRGIHFLKPTWSMEVQNLAEFAGSIHMAEAANPGHVFCVLNVSDREAEIYAKLQIKTVRCDYLMFMDEDTWSLMDEPHPEVPMSKALYVAQMKPYKNHHLAAKLDAPLFVYGDPNTEIAKSYFDLAKKTNPTGLFLNHHLGQGAYRRFNPAEIRQIMARAGVKVALSTVEGAMRAATEALLAGLPVVAVPSLGGRSAFFTSDTALIVEPTPEAVRQGVDDMLARRLNKNDVRRATLDLIHKARKVFFEDANRIIQAHLGPVAPELTLKPLIGFVQRLDLMKTMIEDLE